MRTALALLAAATACTPNPFDPTAVRVYLGETRWTCDDGGAGDAGFTLCASADSVASVSKPWVSAACVEAVGGIEAAAGCQCNATLTPVLDAGGCFPFRCVDGLDGGGTVDLLCAPSVPVASAQSDLQSNRAGSRCVPTSNAPPVCY